MFRRAGACDVVVTAFRARLQAIKAELEVVQDDLGGTRKDKFILQAKVVELRNSMKTLLQQNQQLKQDLKQGRLRKVRRPAHCLSQRLAGPYSACCSTLLGPLFLRMKP